MTMHYSPSWLRYTAHMTKTWP